MDIAPLAAGAVLAVAVLGSAGEAAADGYGYCYAEWNEDGRKVPVFTSVFATAAVDQEAVVNAFRAHARSISQSPEPAAVCSFSDGEADVMARRDWWIGFYAGTMGLGVREIPWRPSPADLQAARTSSPPTP